jgi:hypothetical protein
MIPAITSRSTIGRLGRIAVLCLAVTVGAGAVAAGAGAAKKKKAKTGGVVDITQQVNATIPDATATTNGLVASSIVVGGKKLKGTRVRDVNLTLQTTGSNTNAAGQLNARLTSPNGTTTWLFGDSASQIQGASIGPLTLDDETPVNLGGLPPALDTLTLVAPYAGTAQPNCFSSQGACTLSAMDNGPVAGIWTLRVSDSGTFGAATSVLNNWRLTVVAGRAFRTG